MALLMIYVHGISRALYHTEQLMRELLVGSLENGRTLKTNLGTGKVRAVAAASLKVPFR